MDLGLGVDIGLVSRAEAAGTLGGLVFGACMQRLAERSPPPGSWRRALPWLAALAVLLLLVVEEPAPAGSQDVRWPVLWLAPRFVVYPAGAVALVQMSAAVAGRSRAAPLATAAPWVRGLLLAVLALEMTPGSSLRTFAALSVPTIAVVGLAWRLRRPPLPGAVLVLEGAVVGKSIWSDSHFVPRHVDPGYFWAAEVLWIASLPATAACIRWCRVDRARLAGLGIDLHAPGEVAAVALTAAQFGIVLIVETLYGGVVSGTDYAVLYRIMISTQLVTLALFLFALRYLRRVLDAAEARGRARAA